MYKFTTEQLRDLVIHLSTHLDLYFQNKTKRQIAAENSRFSQQFHSPIYHRNSKKIDTKGVIAVILTKYPKFLYRTSTEAYWVSFKNNKERKEIINQLYTSVSNHP